MTTIPSQLPQIVTAARPGALQALALQSGQVLDATIVGSAGNGTTQVQIRGQLLNLVLPVPVQAGETIKLQVQGTGPQLRLALQAPPAAAPAPPNAAAPPPATMPLPPQQASLPLPPQAPSTALPPSPQQPAQAAVTAGVSPTATTPTTSTAAAAPPGPAIAGAPPLVTAGSGPPSRIPYPQAPPASPLPLAAATTAQLAAAPAVPSAQTGTRPVTAATAIGKASGSPLPPNVPQQPLPMPATPQAALTQMVHDAVPRQGSVVALTTALEAIAGKVALPEPVLRASRQVLAGRTAIDTPRFDGAALQAAIKGSGIFQEAELAAGQLPLPQGDMKSALLALRQSLVTWLGPQAAMPAVTQVPPPLKGLTPRARSEDPAPLDIDVPSEEVGKHLLERTESALARTRLHQHASLPDAVARTADWSLDLPVLIGQHQTLMQFQIHRDQQGESDAVAERGWQMRFAINLPELGEVGAQVSLRGGTTGVMLWATDPEASAALDSEVGLLREALAAAGLRLGAVIVRHGEPPAPAQPPSGHLLDARS